MNQESLEGKLNRLRQAIKIPNTIHSGTDIHVPDGEHERIGPLARPDEIKQEMRIRERQSSF